MQKILSIILALTTSLVYGHSEKNYYQVDVIAFIHQTEADSSRHERLLTAPVMLSQQKGIELKPDRDERLTPYHLRPSKTSALNKEFHVLRQRPQYQVLFHYTWLQPDNNQRSVKLPPVHQNGWLVNGSMRIRKSNYYLVDAELYFTSPDSSEPSFVFKQMQRLKNNSLYYLDHPVAGMLIKIHKLS